MDSKTRNNISVYSLGHALVDATCAGTLFAVFALGVLSTQSFVLLLAVYTILAFGLQFLLGLLLDEWRKPVEGAALGLALTATATVFLQEPWVAVLFLGVGNALFHVGGGIISLNLNRGKASLPGIYVSTGAIGLLVGTLVGSSGNFVSWHFVLATIICVAAIFKLKKPFVNPKTKLEGNFKWFEITVLLILMSICIRGLVGLSLVLPWKTNLSLLVALTISIALGKALGGILGDKIGWMRVAILGLLFSAPLLSFFQEAPALVILGAFLFNLTMPITLTALAGLFPGRTGFAFGLTTLALLAGALPNFTRMKYFFDELTLFTLILVSVAVLYYGLKLFFREFKAKSYKQ